MNFLFRRPPGGHVFMSTQDPEYLYTILCGHCDYPIEEDDAVCPRCQHELEDCPVCRHPRHMKARKVDADPQTGLKECPVCQTRRIPFGGMPLTEIQGSFCRNIYGCWAGGLLLHNEEFAVLRPNASRCPICMHSDLTPLDVRIFLYLVSRCLYCNSVFGPLPTWAPGKWRGWEPSLSSLRDVGYDASAPCILCGRQDKLIDHDTVGYAEGTGPDDLRWTPIPALHYLRVAELGRVLVLEKNPDQAFQKLFDQWFEPSRTAQPEVSVPVETVSRILLEGTREVPILRMLRLRVEEMLRSWGHRVPSEGLNYKLTARDARSKK